MRLSIRNVASLFLVVAIASPVMTTGCKSETVYYNQWEHETHREHQELNRRTEAEKQEYAEWLRTHRDHH
jgi:hypothetical protein